MSFWGGRRGLIYCWGLKRRNSFWILAMLVVLIKVESGFSHFDTQIIREPVMTSIMGHSGLITPLDWIVIDYIGITSRAAESTDVAPKQRKTWSLLHIWICIKLSADHLHQAFNSWAKLWSSQPKSQHRSHRVLFLILDGWLSIFRICLFTNPAKINKMIRIFEHARQC